MNGLSVSELCCLFCCPPCPSKIVAKLAFLPPQPTYKLIVSGDQTLYPTPASEQTALQNNGTTNGGTSNNRSSAPNSSNNATPASNGPNHNNNGQGNFFSNFLQVLRSSGTRLCSSMVCSQSYAAQQAYGQNGALYMPPQVHTNAKIVMMEKAEWQYGPMELERLESFLTRTERGHHIACLFVRCTNNPKYTILFSHGNAVDLGQMSSFYYGLGSRLECNIFTYDYSGYGASGGRPSEKDLYSDIRAAWNALRSRYGISPSNIILYGQSIGTVPTVDLASRYDCAGVILHAPLMSGMRVAFNTSRTWCCDAFPSIDKVNRIGSLVLVIHGTEDEVIDFSHGMAIHEKCQKPVDPLWVEGAGHNDIEIYAQYIERLKRFINEEIRNHQYSIMSAAHAQQLAAQLTNNNHGTATITPLNNNNGNNNLVSSPVVVPMTQSASTTTAPQTTQPTATVNDSPTVNSPLKTDILNP